MSSTGEYTAPSFLLGGVQFSLGELLAKARTDAGIARRGDMADLMRVTSKTIRNWEHDHWVSLASVGFWAERCLEHTEPSKRQAAQILKEFAAEGGAEQDIRKSRCFTGYLAAVG